jgi:branched-chain amino acid transport system ATP-binding protein
MLRIDGLQCGYGRIPVLTGVGISVGSVAAGDRSVAAGDIHESVGLFGPNGAGKTTLINAVMGIIRPRAGAITLDGEDLTKLKTHEIARAGIALVPQERELFPGMSVADNLELGAAYIPRAREGSALQLEVVFSLFPILRERYRQLVGTMSGGQQRMVAIGRALMANPRLLILDEPSLGLQPSIVSEVFETLARLKTSVSILVTEQNVRESLRAVDRGYVLENGAVALEDTAAGLSNNPHVIRSYLGI